MAKNIFNTEHQHQDVSNKIVVGLERISEAFKMLLWEYAKIVGLSPIQIQLLLFVAYHSENLCKVSQLAKEFNVSKPTISDAIKSLENKALITKQSSPTDSRSYFIGLTKTGQTMVEATENFADPIKASLNVLDQESRNVLFDSLSKVIYELNKKGILTVQRTCHACQYLESTGTNNRCQLMNNNLSKADIRLDCPEFELR